MAVTLVLLAVAVSTTMVPLRFSLGFVPRKTKEGTPLVSPPLPTKDSLVASDKELRAEEVSRLELQDLGLAKPLHVLVEAPM